MWVYEGALYDPLDGRKVANVEGLEIVRHLADWEEFTMKEDNAEEKQKYQRRVGDLIFPNLLLSSPNRNKAEDFASTILSRKLFCYQSPQQPRRLLDSIRLRHNAPLRKIPTHQAVAVYDSATTFLSRENGQELLVHTETPKGKSLWAAATANAAAATTTTDSSPTTFLEYTVLAKQRAKGDDLPDLSTSTARPMKDGVVIAPKRSKLVQFGGSPPQEQTRFGARETYSYTMEPTKASNNRNNPFQWFQQWSLRRRQHVPPLDSCRVRYTRYGEGPPWYGPGRFCTLELRGRRVDSLQEAPPVAAAVCHKVPGFLAVHTPLTEDGAAQEALAWFRRNDGHRLALATEEPDRLPDGGKVAQWVYRVKRTGSHVVRRLRASSSLGPAVISE